MRARRRLAALAVCLVSVALPACSSINGTVPGVGSFYSLSIKAPQPIVAYMAHFDSTFFGGFGTLGMPLGLEQPLS